MTHYTILARNVSLAFGDTIGLPKEKLVKLRLILDVG